MHRVGLEKVLQGELALGESEIFRRLGGDIQKRIARASGHIILDLRNQGRHQIEGLMDVGKLVQQFDHAVIVFQRMQAHPGQPVLARDQILVIRLVLMPEYNHAQNGH